MQSQRRSYSKYFKAQVVQECAQPGASIASVAQKHSLNANLVHKWIRVLTNKTMALQPAFIPVPLPLTSWASGTVSWSVMISPATRPASSWASPKSAAWPMHAANSLTCMQSIKASWRSRRFTRLAGCMKSSDTPRK
ncbi:TPA: IS66 family insertion sequence hypothetical protein [Pseudomonas aeruginosa]|nr:IS66 family insertion sequence hypothetical protein [Pseudomonas aeruginosa]